ncbi:MAG: hypothetical protein CSA63_00080 [Propionibacterium sp.]|nr:MAG: hypothetical protein CSA63_00080 [Propionibacterium sp.]
MSGASPSLHYTERLTAAGIKASAGSKGDPYDNALAETINGLYKTELIYNRPTWPSTTAVEIETMCWVHLWNHQRLHEALDYQTPAQKSNTPILKPVPSPWQAHQHRKRNKTQHGSYWLA